MNRRASGALALPALTSPGLRAVLGFCVAVPWVVVAVAWVTAPATRPFAVVAPAFSLFVLVLVWRVRELEGAVLRERRMGVLTRALDLSTARRVEVRGNRAGAVVLQVHSASSRRGLTLVLQAKTAYVDAARPLTSSRRSRRRSPVPRRPAPAGRPGCCARRLRTCGPQGTTALLHWPRSPGTSPAWWEAPGWLGAPPGCSTELRLPACRSALRAASHRSRRASRWSRPRASLPGR